MAVGETAVAVKPDGALGSVGRIENISESAGISPAELAVNVYVDATEPVTVTAVNVASPDDAATLVTVPPNVAPALAVRDTGLVAVVTLLL